MRILKALSAFTVVIGLASVLSSCAIVTGRESGSEYSQDVGTTAEIKAKIASDSDIGPLQISVETFKDVVQLSGFVTTQAQKDKAEKLAKSVTIKDNNGHNVAVKVKNNIIVR